MSHRPTVMVVDDDLATCAFLRDFLMLRGYSALTVTSADEAVRLFNLDRPDAVLLDVVMPGSSMDGLGALAAFKKIDRDVPIIVMSGQGRTNTVVQAVKLGAADFASKPFEEAEFEAILANALKQRHLNQQLASLRAQLKEECSYSTLFGHSEKMAQVRDVIERVADTDVTVLIRGESGTGKELVARALHSQSLRKDKPFLKVNCAALPSELLESELFGYEKGAFTGAIHHKPGKFEFANQGTIFLDEIGDIGFPLQAKLLQVLQDGEFSRLGGRGDVHVDVRVLAATNRDLELAVAEGQFREDLYFRLNVVTIQLPPLRERREEVPLLVDHFLKKYSVQYNKPVASISRQLQQQLEAYDWPGNVRQLENLMKRMVVLGMEAPIMRELQQPSTRPLFRVPIATVPSRSVPPPQPEMPPPVAAVSSPVAGSPARGPSGTSLAAANGHPAGPNGSTNGAPAPAPIDRDKTNGSSAANVSLKEIARTAARQAERDLILRMLTRTRWNRKEAAEILGISYKALLYKIKENGLDKAS
jgi:two-component system, NtrC family, response regulator AtoC